MIKSYFNWSGGKDSSLALYHALKDKNFSIEKLLTSVNQTYGRISMHGVREELLDAQVKEIGIPLQKLMLQDQPSMSDYEKVLRKNVDQLKEEGFVNSMFGDIFLEDLKKYREEKLAEVGVSAHFPIWKRDTKELLNEFLDLGFKTILVCVKSEVLDQSFAGRIINKDFINDLPDNVDPCGENGEFHTFVFDGPIFKNPIPIEIGETVFREYKQPKNTDDTCNGSSTSHMGFWFTDLTLKK